MSDYISQMYGKMNIRDAPIRTSRRRKRQCLYFNCKRELERLRITRKTQALSRVKDTTLLEIAKTPDFGDVNSVDRPLAMDASMCKNFIVVNEQEDKEEDEEKIVEYFEVVIYTCMH